MTQRISFITLTWEYVGVNVTSTPLVEHSWKTHIKFLSKAGIHNMLLIKKVWVKEGSNNEPVCEILRPEPSQRIASSPPLYGVWRERLATSDVMWCDSPKSSNQVEELRFFTATLAMGCHVCGCGCYCHGWEDYHGGVEFLQTIWNSGKYLHYVHFFPQAKHLPKYGCEKRS